jgi:chromosome segregation ATPase
MDIFKLRNDYLKKINKTASELNRRLDFLNEINNNMIGGGGAATKSVGAIKSTATKSVTDIMNDNSITVGQITTLIKEMKTKVIARDSTITSLQNDNKGLQMSIDSLNTDKNKLQANIEKLESSSTTTTSEIEKIKSENSRYMADIETLNKFLQDTLGGIKTEINKP